MVNKVILLGRLGKEPESRTTQNGKMICSFTMATESGYGESKKTDWHSVTCFDKTADAVSKYLHKGSQCYVEGRISYDTYEGKDGVKRTSTRIIASDIKFIGSKSDNAQQPLQNNAPLEQKAVSDDTFEGVPFYSNDEIPF